MYFWNIEGLKDHIKEGSLTEKSRMLYFLVMLLMMAAMNQFASSLPVYSKTSRDYALMAFGLAWLVAALYLAYRANNGNGGSDFLGRYMSISFVVGNRVIVWTIILYFAYLIGEMIVFGIPEDEPPELVIKPSVTASLKVMAWNSFIMWRIIVHLKDVSGVTSLFKNTNQKVAP